MTISSNLNYFNGKSVVDFNSKTGIYDETKVYRIRTDFDKEDGPIEELIDKYCADPKAASIEELVIGIWDFEGGNSSSTIAKLIENKDKLPKLKYLMLGDITYEENEMSWIEQGNVVSLLHAYPNLVHFQVRGGNGLSFRGLSHKKLQKLIVETGGLAAEISAQILKADLPELQHLELWLGDDNYGFSGSAKNFQELLDGELFPKLKYIGLVNSKIADDIAVACKGAAILDRIEVLDLSKGTLSDVGGQALLDNDKLKKLRFVDLHHHYMTDEILGKLKEKIGDFADLTEQMDEDEGDRYVEVSE